MSDEVDEFLDGMDQDGPQWNEIREFFGEDVVKLFQLCRGVTSLATDAFEALQRVAALEGEKQKKTKQDEKYWQRRAREAEDGENKQCNIITSLRAQLTEMELRAQKAERRDPDRTLSALLRELPEGVRVQFRTTRRTLVVNVIHHDPSARARDLVETTVLSSAMLENASCPSDRLVTLIEASLANVVREAETFDEEHRELGGEG